MNEEIISVTQEEASQRLDKLLSLRFPAYSRSYFEYLIEEGCVLVAGKRLKKREKPKCGEEIEICFQLTPEISLEPQNIPLDILYEDEQIIAINKPAGMVVHPAPGHPSNTFVNALLFHCKQLERERENQRPGIVHRLDKETSGVLLAAKTRAAHQALISLFCNREIDKRYLAICVGNPGNITIDAPLGRHPVKRKEIAICSEGGKEAKSECRVLQEKGKLTLVEVHPISGRTHQIRVHLKSVGTPILGDSTYGIASTNQKFDAKRQMLHAHRLTFIHPFTLKELAITAPIPHDLSNFFSF
jgi:23S rRNA pseudouridine1911/1915/1917 synthase